MVDDLAKKRQMKLLDKGVDHLQQGRYVEALQAAAELEDVEGGLAFYLAGETFAAMNQMKDAIASMRRGVLKRPTFWVNWFFLGVYLGRCHKYEEALAAYSQAMLCPLADIDLLRLNMAIASIECGEYATALAYLDAVDNRSSQWSIDSSRILALEGLGRIAEAAELAEQFLNAQPEGDEEYNHRVGYVAAALARIRLRQGGSKEEAREFLLQCLEEYGCSARVLYELRRLKELCYSKDSKHFRFVMHATLPVGHPWYRESAGYGIVYDVFSDSESRALDMINDFESAIGIERLEVVDTEIKDARPEDPMGVYWVSERFF